jgi:hypothetical protein
MRNVLAERLGRSSFAHTAWNLSNADPFPDSDIRTIGTEHVGIQEAAARKLPHADPDLNCRISG